MGGGGSGNAFIDYAIRQSEEKKRRAEQKQSLVDARGRTVPLEDKKRLAAAGTAKRRQRKQGRQSTLLSKQESDGQVLGQA